MGQRYDIFISSGEPQFERLLGLLPLLRPHGTVHLCSSFLSEEQVRRVAPQVDFVHHPPHSPDPYENFNLFFIRDLARLATAHHFIKLDTDIRLREDWISYVDECLADVPDAVLFGAHAGSNRVEYDISGPLVRRRLGGDVLVRGGLKVNGSFYVGQTRFFKQHDRTLQLLHDLVYAFRDGHRTRPSHLDDAGREDDLGGRARVRVRMRGDCALRQGQAVEDTLRNLAVHVVGASDRIFVRDPGERMFLPDKANAPSGFKRAGKWLKSRAGVPWRSTKRPASQPARGPAR